MANELVSIIHEMSINKLPKFEMYEVGSQIRRSIKSVKSNIVEGFARREYQQEFIHFLIIAKGSVDETSDHLDTLFNTKSLTDPVLYNTLSKKLDILSRKLFHLIKSIKERQGKQSH